MKRILIVEDDSAIRELETDYLEAAGFAVETAGEGRKGRAMALAGGYDLIVLDIMLPFVDGFAICETVRKEQETPILFVTAKQEDSDKIRGLGYGADDYIVKPFSPAEFVARVKAHLARYERLTGEKERRCHRRHGDRARAREPPARKNRAGSRKARLRRDGLGRRVPVQRMKTKRKLRKDERSFLFLCRKI